LLDTKDDIRIAQVTTLRSDKRNLEVNESGLEAISQVLANLGYL
jgi:hypothetical protein